MILVIGYGNPLRRDDGVGWATVAQIQDLILEDVICVTAHLLLPEHSDMVAGADMVILVDASIEGSAGDVHITPVLPADESPVMTHHLSPQSLLAMTKWLYDKLPFTILITITGADFGMGEGLSDRVAEKMNLLAGWVKWCADNRCATLLSWAGKNDPHS